MKIRCFVDVNGHIWSIDPKGGSNYPGPIQINEDDVWVLGTDDGDGRAVEEEYVLWASLTELAIAIEQSPVKSNDGSVSLDQAIAEAHVATESFKKNWLKEHAVSPEKFPLVLPLENAGLWAEQMMDHQ